MESSYVSSGPERSALKGYIFTVLVLLICVAAQAVWPPWLRLRGQPPDLTLAAVLSIGLTTGAMSGLFSGFLGAYLWASVAGVAMGNLFISHMGLGFLSGAMRGKMFSDRLSLAVILVAAGVVVASVINLLLAPPPSPQSWVIAVLAKAIYSGIMTIPLYGLMRVLARHYPDPQDL
ncbi:MAG: hypothetical protein ABFE08_00250 [Armatimonadia bacterium]